MAWYFLLFSAVCEAFYNVALKRIAGWGDIKNIALAAALLAFGIVGFKKGVDQINLSIAAVVWSGVSLAFTILLDIILYKAKFDWRIAFFMCLCVISIVGLNYYSKR